MLYDVSLLICVSVFVKFNPLGQVSSSNSHLPDRQFTVAQAKHDFNVLQRVLEASHAGLN